MNRSERQEGDALASDLIRQYWADFENCNTWNYFTYPGRYVERDTWASDDQWRNAALRMLELGSCLPSAYSILLSLEFEQHFSSAQSYIRRWHSETGGHDPEYLYDVLKHFPEEDELRKRYLWDPSEPLNDREGILGVCREARLALASVEDKDFCGLMAQQLSEWLTQGNLAETEFEDSVLERMVELGEACNKLIARDRIDAAKLFVYESLEKDRQIVEGARIEEDERSLWLRDDIGYFAARLNWEDVLLELRRAKWYWKSQFCEWWSDRDNN
ncbi:MAG: hypothetical protein AAFY15_15080, partial [Cyanobacteria bacterium J06648_11]